MKKNYITKTLGGLTVMFSIFLFFAAAKQMSNMNNEFSASVTSGTVDSSNIENPADTVNDKVVTGTFNPRSSGNIKYAYDEKKSIKFSYMAIKSPRLKNEQLNPNLKLQVTNSEGEKEWKETSWSWIDYDQGILYFHYITEKDGEKKLEENYTGKYQIILN